MMADKSMRLSDCTNTIFTRSSLGVDNSSTLGSWNIENETVLSQNSDISLKKIVDNKSFIEKVKQSFNATEISAAFPRGSLNNELLKKKKRRSSSVLDTIKSPLKSSFSITESLPSPVKNVPERKCAVDISSSKSASDYFSNGLDSGTVNRKSNTLNEISKKRVSVNVRYDSTTLSNQTKEKDSGKEMSNALEEHSNVSNLEVEHVSEKNSKICSEKACNESALSGNNLANSRRSSRRLKGKQTNLNSSNIQNINPVNHNMSLRNLTGEKISINDDLTSNEQLVSIKKEEDSDGFDLVNSDEINKSQTERTNLSQNQHSLRNSVQGFSQQSVLNSSQINTVDVGKNTGIEILDIRDTSTRQLVNNSTYTIETHNSIIKGAIDEDNILLDNSCHRSSHFDKPSNENSLSSIQSVPEPLLPLPSFHNKNDIIESNSVILKSGVEGINTQDEAKNKLNDSIQRYKSQENTHSFRISEPANIKKKKKLSKSISGTDLDPHNDEIDLQNESGPNFLMNKSTSYSNNKSISQKENHHEIKTNKTVIETMPLNGITLSGITPSKNKSMPIENPRQSPSKCNGEISNVDVDTGSQSKILNAKVQLGNTEVSVKEDIVNSELMKSNGEVHTIKVRRSLRRSVTFANTVRFKSDSRSGEISISISPTDPNNPSSSEKTKDLQNPVNSENTSLADNVEPGQQSVLKSPHVEKEMIEYTNSTKCNEENQDNYICPEKKSINGKRVIELYETNGKRMCTEERTPLKNKRPSEKTINELSYDTYSDVSEIPLEKTILQKKLIYHSTPKYSVLEKHASSNRSIRRSFRLQKNCKDQVIQVSKSIFGTSSEVTSGRKTSKELSTSYSFQQKVVQPKRKSSAKNDTEKECDQQHNSSYLSTSSSPLSPTISRKYYSSSDGNKASNEDSSAIKCIPNFTSTVTNSLANSLQYQTKKTVCFKDFSSHIEYTNQKSTQGSSNFKTSVSSLYTPTVTCSVAENYSRNNTSSPQKNDASESNFRTQSSKHSLSLSRVHHDFVSSKPVSELSIATHDLKSILIYENQHKKSIQHKQLNDSLEFINNNKKLKRRYDYESDERFMIGCTSYKPLSTKFPAKWVHPDLLKFICSKLNQNYDTLECKVIAQKIITLLCATVSAVDRLDNQNDIEASVLLLKNLICKYEICVNVMDYCTFIYRFTPFSFRRKMFSEKGKLFHSKAGSPIINASEKIPIQ